MKNVLRKLVLACALLASAGAAAFATEADEKAIAAFQNITGEYTLVHAASANTPSGFMMTLNYMRPAPEGAIFVSSVAFRETQKVWHSKNLITFNPPKGEYRVLSSLRYNREGKKIREDGPADWIAVIPNSAVEKVQKILSGEYTEGQVKAFNAEKREAFEALFKRVIRGDGVYETDLPNPAYPPRPME